MEQLKKSLKEEIMETLKEYHGNEAETMFNFFFAMSRPKIERYSRDIIWKIRYLKFHHTRGRKLGDKTKAMPDSIYLRVIEHFKKIKDDELALAYELEGIEGCRIGDLISLQLDNIDFDRHIMRIYNHKSKRWYEIPIDKSIEADLQTFIVEQHNEIAKHNNYIFFTRDDEHHPNRKEEHLTQQYINRKLVKYLDEIGVNQVYAHRAGDNGKLHLFTTHSGRGHAATRIKNLTGKKEDAAMLLNHSPRSVDSTELYFERDDGDLFKVMR